MFPPELVIVGLLRAAWIAGILPILGASIPSSRLNSFHQIVSGFAERGKIKQSSSHKFTVPQRFFCQFYVVGVMWTTLLIIANWFYAYRMMPTISEPLLYSSFANYLTGGSNIFSSLYKFHSSTTEQWYIVWQSVFLLLLMEAQVLRRLFETIYVFKYSPSARMHIFAYLTGLYFYTAAPLSLCCTFAPEVFKFATNWMEEFIVKGKNQMAVTEFDAWGFIYPLMRQRCSPGSLRENTAQAEAYAVPEGDWFDYVSSAHYLAEIVIYAGLLVTSGCADLTIWLLFAFVVANLTLAAADTHRWYLHKFDNYPSNRWAIIPLVY